MVKPTDHVGDDVLVEREHEREGEAGDQVGPDQRQHDGAEHGPVVGAERRGRLGQRPVDRGEADGQGDQRQSGEEDRVADDRGPEPPVGAERRPEGQEAKRGDHRRHQERRQPEHLEDPRPGRDPAPAEPGQRQRDEHGQRRRQPGQQQRVGERGPPLRVGEDLPIPAEREALRREDQALLRVHRHAGDDHQRQREEHRHRAPSTAARSCRPPAADQQRQPDQRQRDQHQEDRHRRGERDVRLVDRLVGDQHAERPVARAPEDLRQEIRAEREHEDHDQRRQDRRPRHRHDDVEERAERRRPHAARRLGQRRIEPGQRRVEHQHGIGQRLVDHAGQHRAEARGQRHRLGHQADGDQQVGEPGGAREQRRPGEADDHLREREHREDRHQPGDLGAPRPAGQEPGEREGDDHADQRHEHGEQQREGEHLAEERAQEPGVVVEHEGGRVERRPDRAGRS